MKKAKHILVVFLIAVVTFVTTVPAFASDWDKAGIALTGIEGLRILSGGKIDVVGSVFGLGRSSSSHQEHQRHNKHKKGPKYTRIERKYDCYERVWVPHYKWEKKYIPEHEEYDERLGTIIVPGHYIKYQVTCGGHWETKHYCY